MPLQSTKKKIIKTTIELFNRDGFANVSLQHIATELAISLGNLTYHFPKKDQLILSVYETFVEELAAITKNYQTFADLAEIDRQLRQFYHFQQSYRFFYLDLLELERAYPEIAEQHQTHIENQIQGLYNYFLFNVGSGNLQSFNSSKIYEQLAHQTWITVAFWPMQLAVRGKKSNIADMLDAVWTQLQPYITEKGRENFQNTYNYGSNYQRFL